MDKFIPFAQPLFGKEEKDEVLDALDSGWVTLGPRTHQFEEDFAKYVGSKYAVAMSSCTAGLFLSLLASGISKGDEVITTILTFAATANPIVQLGGVPIFVDVMEDSLNIDVSKIEEKITKKTKALMIMHYGGQAVDMAKVKSLAKKYKLLIIEDAATAVGTEYKGTRIGNIGDATVFSFHAIKNMSTGDGGMVTTNNKNLYDKLCLLRLHGMSKDAWKRHSAVGSWRYDVSLPGYKFNMTDIQAALGIQQLKKLDKFIAVRQKYASIYDEKFSKIAEIRVPHNDTSNRHARNLYTVQIDISKLTITRDQIVEEMKKRNIGANVYYMPLYELSFYKKDLKVKPSDFPVAQKVFKKMLTLPLYPKMTIEEVNYVADTLIEIVTNFKSK
jgi:dTDP-4-amino-4,6-dideoxygalactose transaminase